MKEVVIEIKVEGADEAEESLGQVEKSINDVNKAAKNTKLNIGDSINKDVKDATNNLDGFEKKLVKTNEVMKNSKGTAQLLGGSVRVAGTAFAALGVQSTEVTNALGKVQGIGQFAGGVRDLTKGLGNLGGGFKVLGIAAKAVPFVGIGLAIFEVAKSTGILDGALKKAGLAFEEASVLATAFNETSQKSLALYAKEKVGLDELFNSLQDVNTTTEDKKRIIDEVNNKYGEYLPNLLTEKSTNEEIAVAYDLVNSALIRKALTQAKTNALEIATTDLLNKRLAIQKDLAKVEKELQFISSTEQLNRLNKQKEDILKEIANIEDKFKTEVAKIDKVAKDLEQNLFKPTSGLTPEELEAKRLEAERRKQQNKTKTQNTAAAKDRLSLLAKEQQDALKLIQERYAKEIDDINDAKVLQENLLKEDLANRVITQQQFDDAILALNVGVNNKLLKQNENFIVTDAEKKKIGADGELILQEQLNDDKLKVNGTYLDALNVVNAKQDERTKAQREKDAEDEKKRLDDIAAEEKRIVQERLDNFNNEYILKKTALLQDVNLKEKELDVELQKAQIQNLQNQLSVYALGSDEYFKLIEQIAEAQRKLNQTLVKNTEETQKEALENIKQLVEGISDIIQDVSKNFESVGQTGLQTLEDITNKVPDLIAKFQDETLSETEKLAAGFAFVGASIGEINNIIQDASEERIAAIDSEEQARIAALQRQKDAGLITEQQLASGTQRIQEEYAKKRRAAEKKAFIQEKGVRIAQAVAQTASAVLAAYSSGVATPIIGPATGAIYAGIAAAFGAAQIALIASQKFPESGGGGGSSSPQAPSPPTGSGGQPTSFAPATFGSGISQSQTFGAQQGTGGGVLRAYVSETDLTETQRRLRNIRSAGEL